MKRGLRRVAEDLPGWLLLAGAWLLAILFFNDLPAVPTSRKSSSQDESESA